MAEYVYHISYNLKGSGDIHGFGHTTHKRDYPILTVNDVRSLSDVLSREVEKDSGGNGPFNIVIIAISLLSINGKLPTMYG